MEEKTYGLVERKDWPSGAWDDEPDHVEWRDEATGLPCIITRQWSSGHLCGYVAVPPGHPLHGHSYNCRATDGSSLLGEDLDGNFTYDYNAETVDSVLSVHGGVTYSDFCHGDVCHVAKEGEPDDVYWFGFDCHHCDDASPKFDGPEGYFAKRGYPRDHKVYRDVAYVCAECTSLAKQLANYAAARGRS